MTPGPCPTIPTARIVLRPFEMRDFGAFAAIWAMPEVIRFILPAPRTEAESWRAFQAYAGSWLLLGYGHWTAEDRADGGYLGHLGFFQGWRGLGPEFDSVPECGWVFGPRAWGRGLAREAVGAIHDWFDAERPGGRSAAMIAEGHAASARVAEGAGYRVFDRVTLGGEGVALYARAPAGG